MKQIFRPTITLLLLAALALGAAAQETPLQVPRRLPQPQSSVLYTADGSQRLGAITVESKPGSATVSYEARVVLPKTDYATVITPLICGRTDTLRLEPVTIRGARNAKKLERSHRLNRKLGPVPPYTPAAAAPQTIGGTLELPVGRYPWVRSEALTLCVEAVSEGCCNITPLYNFCSTPVAFEQPFFPAVATVPDNTGRGGTLAKDHPVLQHISQYRPYDTTRILRKESGVLYVHFPLDRATLLHDFRDNGPILDTIVSITRQIMADTTSTVKLIQIIGLASVEGPQKRNQWLGEHRADALKQYVIDHTGASPDVFECVNGGEAWTELRDQINDGHFDGRDALLSIIDTEPDPDRREARMRQLDGGRPYDYLRNNVLADQRNSGYLRIYYDYVPDTAAAVINDASRLLAKEQWHAALEKLQPVKADLRAQNALGVALYMTGQHDAALDCFRRAAATGNAQARENLRQLE